MGSVAGAAESVLCYSLKPERAPGGAEPSTVTLGHCSQAEVATGLLPGHAVLVSPLHSEFNTALFVFHHENECVSLGI